jgi:hypothetical protein
MIRINIWTKDASGQVLLATLLFCFIFITLFVGLYKSGLLYNAKEQAIRASNSTALSAGAVYANGLQLVRVSNVILLGAAVIDLVAITLLLDATGGLASFLPSNMKDLNTRKLVQNIQKILFGVGIPSGVYPLLISTETLSIASQNGLKNNWPGLNPLSWSVPTSIPSPILIYNVATIGPGLAEAIVPNMALKFRDASLFLNALPKEKEVYKLKRKSNGQTVVFNSDQVEKVPNTNGLYRVKKELNIEDAGKFVSKDVSEGLSKLNKLIKFANLLAALTIDVTDRDDPPVHNIFVYASYPTSVTDSNGNSTAIQTLSQVNVSGTGLAAWNINDPPYISTLAATDPVELVKQVGIQSLVSQLIGSGKLPKITDIFGMVLNGSL